MFNIVNVKNCRQNSTIYEYLKENKFSENYIKNLRKKEGYIKLNGVVAFTNALVKNGDVIELFSNPHTKSGTMYCVVPLDVVYENEDILVVNKPSNMPSIPSRKHLTYNLAGAVANYMKDKDSNFVVRIVNRLDKEACGLVCIAKHSYICNLLNRTENVKKTYYAVCVGKVEQSTINKKIATTKNIFGYNNQKREINEIGKPAITNITPVFFDGKNTLCEIKIQYGRTHQIRLHLASINHPLVGDSLYGNACDSFDHTALCCAKMDIYNPLKDKTISLKIDLPSEFNKIINYHLNI